MHSGTSDSSSLCSPSDELRGNAPEDLLARALESQPSAPLPRDWSPPEPAHLARLLPQYQIEGLIGRGGMGAVYKGSQPKLNRPVAIKILPAELADDLAFVARFEREAQTLASLSHPGIVTIFDFGQTSEGYLYFVMEHVDGTDLNRVIHGPELDVALSLGLTIQICEALQYAHDKGVVHRDIKPANVLVTREGRAKLADFGLAFIPQTDLEDTIPPHAPIPQQTGSDNSTGRLTLPGTTLGTPGYAAPEVYDGHQADRRTDIYALGIMLYEMLTGHPPQASFPLPSTEVSVDRRIDQVIVKALEIDPADRYQNASDMKLAVEEVVTPSPMPAAAPSIQAARRPSRRMLVNLLLFFVPMAGIAAAYLLGKGDHKEALETPSKVEPTITFSAPESPPTTVVSPVPEINFLPNNGIRQSTAASQDLQHRVQKKPEEALRNAPPAPPISEVKPEPSRLEIFSQQAPNAMQWVLAALDETVPADIRQNLVRLREDLVDEGKKNPAASIDAYRFGYQLCYAMVAALEERNQTLVRAGYTAAQANAATGVTSPALEASRNHMMSWPQYAREKDQRSELQRQQFNGTDLKKERSKVDWASRSEVLRRHLDGLYRQFRDSMR